MTASDSVIWTLVGALCIALICPALPLSAAIVKSVGTGQWGAAATWDPGVPGSSDDGPGGGDVTIDNNAQTTIATTQLDLAGELGKPKVYIQNYGSVLIASSFVLNTLSVASSNEIVDLGTNGNRVTLWRLLEPGKLLAKAGIYSVTDWNGRTTPTYATGLGDIEVLRGGLVLSIR